MHAITEEHSPADLSRHTLCTAALYVACGLDPEQTALFVQSQIAAHSQLSRLLGAVSTVGHLQRMVQFKEKSIRQGQDVRLGLLDYPVLMAADILLYDADVVPVGADQRQHIELTADLAERFNKVYGTASKPVLKMPVPLVVAETAKVMSITDGRKKMSKSDPNPGSRINLLDTPDTIRSKIKRAKTDSIRGLEFDHPDRPEAHNLLLLYQVLSGKTREQAASECKDMGYGQFKPLLAETVIAYLEPIQKRYTSLISDRHSLTDILRSGKQRAASLAELTLARASEAMGFVA